MGLIMVQPIGKSTFRLSMARGPQHVSDMLKSLIEVPGKRVFLKARIGDSASGEGRGRGQSQLMVINHNYGYENLFYINKLKILTFLG